MKLALTNKKHKETVAKTFDWKQLLEQVRNLILSARRTAARSVDTLQVFTNFRIGRLIVEQEQEGHVRADCGKQVLAKLSNALTAEFDRGFSEDNLSRMRKFYLEYQHVIRPPISAKPSRKLLSSGGLNIELQSSKQETLALGSGVALSWSHYVFLIR